MINVIIGVPILLAVVYGLAVLTGRVFGTLYDCFECKTKRRTCFLTPKCPKCGKKMTPVPTVPASRRVPRWPTRRLVTEYVRSSVG